MSGPQCCRNPPTLGRSSGSGHLEQIANLNSYVSGNPDSKIAVLLVSDAYGYEAPKLRKIADKVACDGYYVIVPDFFHGDPLTPRIPFEDWIKNHDAVEATEFAKLVIEALKEKGISKIGAGGFCWGAKVVVELAKDTTHIQSAVLLHPSYVTVDDIKEVKVPMAILGAEFDNMSPPELLKQFEAALEEKPEIDHFVKIFCGVSHGWTVRYNDDDEAEVKAAQEAIQDLMDWFAKCLKIYCAL